MKPTFFLEKPNQSKPTRIILAVNHEGKKYKFSTGEKVEKGQWNGNKQIVKSNPEASEINERLERLAKALERTLNAIVRAGEQVTRERLTTGMDAILKPNATIEAPKLPSFYVFIEGFINQSENGTRLNKGKAISLYTVKGYKTTLAHLRDFEASTGRPITFEGLTKGFYDSFVSYFYAKGHTINSTGKHIKNLKVFANEAKEKGLAVCADIGRKAFKVLSEDTDQIALSVSELERIEALDLANKPRLDHIRDCFLIACWTGLRFADLKQLAPRNIIDTPEGKRLKVVTQKTGQTVVLPLKPVVIAILEKYNGTPPTPPSNQKFNDYIKEVGQIAGITETVTVAKTRAGRRDETTIQKFELITVHTARRSFATNAYLQGLDTLTIKKMTGHHTEKSFLKYIRVNEEENANRAAKHSFFQ
jgi:integrase